MKSDDMLQEFLLCFITLDGKCNRNFLYFIRQEKIYFVEQKWKLIAATMKWFQEVMIDLKFIISQIVLMIIS